MCSNGGASNLVASLLMRAFKPREERPLANRKPGKLESVSTDWSDAVRSRPDEFGARSKTHDVCLEGSRLGTSAKAVDPAPSDSMDGPRGLAIKLHHRHAPCHLVRLAPHTPLDRPLPPGGRRVALRGCLGPHAAFVGRVLRRCTPEARRPHAKRLPARAHQAAGPPEDRSRERAPSLP
eukprot:2781645-Prymnesium_polylepis.1